VPTLVLSCLTAWYNQEKWDTPARREQDRVARIPIHNCTYQKYATFFIKHNVFTCVWSCKNPMNQGAKSVMAATLQETPAKSSKSGTTCTQCRDIISPASAPRAASPPPDDGHRRFEYLTSPRSFIKVRLRNPKGSIQRACGAFQTLMDELMDFGPASKPIQPSQCLYPPAWSGIFLFSMVLI
jgi:hypothetical protein